MNLYLKSIKKIKNAELSQNLQQTIEKAESINTISDIKKLTRYSKCYRIKIDEYHMGLVIENNKAALVQFQYRKDVYKKFLK